MKLILLVLLAVSAYALDNGLARTPPMGWLAWERFRCIIDCDSDPHNCISEKLFMEIADALVEKGFKDAGYEYVNIDDCWPDMTRVNGKMAANSTRFPHGMAHLANYVHERGLKLGIYTDFGVTTCGGYPGTCGDTSCSNGGFMQTDADTFSSWGIDSLKLDGCNIIQTTAVMNAGYQNMSKSLNETGRPMLYSCSWPAYLNDEKIPPPYPLIAQLCNLWRMYDDIQDSFDSVLEIADWVGDHQADLIKVAGPGNWNDPDMLIIGNYGLSYEQSKAQMAIWSIMAAPLLMGNDPRHISDEMRNILLNKRVIAVNQDEMGMQGRRVVHDTVHGIDIWIRNLKDGQWAAVLWNRSVEGIHKNITLTWQMADFDVNDRFSVEELFTNQHFGTHSRQFSTMVNPAGGVAMLLLTPA